MPLWSEISPQAWPCESNEKRTKVEIISKRVNARRRRGEQMILKRMKSTGDMTEPCGAPALIEYRLVRKIPINLTRVRWKQNIVSLARITLCQMQSKALEISREITLLSPHDSREEDQTWTA